jgi:hypothetical protein
MSSGRSLVVTASGAQSPRAYLKPLILVSNSSDFLDIIAKEEIWKPEIIFGAIRDLPPLSPACEVSCHLSSFGMK